ncbi:ABC transporter ATP-binding protein [Dactylosporangium sp. NPDC050588]|uniref:ABC transporter ATP-binding protein n=1 Tax=Dactylosporangium sp. NPDC050588 TaxID=3157211 RepID=UPI0033CA6CB7
MTVQFFAAGPPPAADHRGRWRAAGAALLLGLRAAPGGYALLVTLAVAGGAAAPVAAWLSKVFIDRLAAGGTSTAAVLWPAIGAALCTTAIAVLSQAGMYVNALVRRRVTIAVQDRLARRLDELVGLRYFEDPGHHDRLRLAGQAADSAPHDVAAFALDTARQGAALTGFVAAMLGVWPPMALILVVTAVPAYLAQRRLVRQQVAVAEAVSPLQRLQFYYRSLMTEAQPAKELRIFGLGDFFRQRMVAALTRSTGTEQAVQRRATLLQSGLTLLNGLVSCVGVAVVVVQAVHGTLTVGDVSLFIAAVAALQGAFGTVIVQFGRVEEAALLLRHYHDFMAGPADLPDGAATAAPLRDRIELRDVWFRYGEDGPWVLRGVDLTIPAGGSLGLVGLNGAGKSTLAKLLCRLYDPTRGTITWDGVDLRDLRVADLRRRISAVFQDFTTYDLTAAENIGVGDLARLGDRAAVERAAAQAGVAAPIERLPHGYGTMISFDFFGASDEAGTMLSGGQLQRLAIARAILREDAGLLILDEPSSGLDPDAEDAVHRTLRQLRAGRSTLLVSHRLGAIRDADQIVVLDGGRIAEHGTHDELMSAGGAYARLFSLQAGRYQDERVASG